MNKQLTYWDFGYDEYMYMTVAYMKGIRRNAMVSQAQHIVEYMLKELLSRQLLNNTQVMQTHNLRQLYDAVTKAGIDISKIRQQIMMLNNFYTHTRYPGRDAYMATTEDIDSTVKATADVYLTIKELL